MQWFVDIGALSISALVEMRTQAGQMTVSKSSLRYRLHAVSTGTSDNHIGQGPHWPHLSHQAGQSMFNQVPKSTKVISIANSQTKPLHSSLSTPPPELPPPSPQNAPPQPPVQNKLGHVVLQRPLQQLLAMPCQLDSPKSRLRSQ